MTLITRLFTRSLNPGAEIPWEEKEIVVGNSFSKRPENRSCPGMASRRTLHRFGYR
jgi:hypothetical protein